MADNYNKPNLIVPLAASYDTRSVAADTTVLSGKDQRKINFYYDIIRNPVTGNATLELVKRPGVSTTGLIVTGNGTPYLVNNVLNEASNTWVFGKETSSNDIYVTNVGTDTTLFTSATYYPGYFDTTIISGTTYGVVQARPNYLNTSSPHRAFFASAIGSWTEITDGDFTGIVHRGKMEHMDGYAFIMGNDEYVYNSDLNSLSAWTAGNRIRKQIRSDVPVGLMKFKNQILACGQESGEIFVNQGNPSGSPLSVVKDRAFSIGIGKMAEAAQSLGQTHYSVELDNRLYFIGRRSATTEAQSLFVYDGQTFEQIGNDSVDRIIGDANPMWIGVVNVYSKTAIAIDLGSNRWLMYFPALNEWFEWTSTVFRPQNDGVNFLDSTQTLYYFAGGNTYVDGSTAYTASIQFRLPKKGNNRDFMRWCALDADTTTSASNVTVSFSDDDYQNFSTGRTIDLNTLEKRLIRCGSYKNRVVKLEHSANAEFRARNFLARVE